LQHNFERVAQILGRSRYALPQREEGAVTSA
jgi:hypothetical protein